MIRGLNGIVDIASVNTDGTREVVTECPLCTKRRNLVIKAGDLLSYQYGISLQKSFGTLSANDREALKTGICSTCWDSMMLNE